MKQDFDKHRLAYDRNDLVTEKAESKSEKRANQYILQLNTCLTIVFISLLAACRSSGFVLFNSVERSLENREYSI